jgi:hypothetical protein
MGALSYPILNCGVLDPLAGCHIHLLCIFVLLTGSGLTSADAVVRTQAMGASTIAEIFIEAESIRVELEIGQADLPAFQAVLPDEIRALLGFEPEAMKARLAHFFAEGMAIEADDSPPIVGRLVSIEGRERLRRDEVSGEVRARREDEPEEMVIFVVLEYPLTGEPRDLAIHGLRGSRPTSVGFVAYHGGIAVNDFRYLSPRQVLHLDWGDPWYTRFETRSLRRQYSAPMTGFLYVEPYEVRKEILARPLDLQRFIDLGLEGLDVITPEMQPELLRRAGEFLRAHQPVEIDGRTIEPELARIHFLERTLRTSRVIDPPEPLDVHAAMLGAIFVYPTDGLPDRVTLDWDLWHERLAQIPAATVDQAGPLPSFLEPDSRVLEWQNFLKHPELPTLRDVARPPALWERGLDWMAAPLGLVALSVIILGLVRRRLSLLYPAAAIGAAAVLAFFASSATRLSDERAAEVLGGLLHNVYRAFDFRDEERIYDTLSRSASGDLLEQIYLETRQGLELQGQGGARAKVKEVTLEDVEAQSSEDGAFSAHATWQVSGSVGHWGHVHQRRNRYRADLTVAPIDGAWRLTRVEVREEERL